MHIVDGVNLPVSNISTVVIPENEVAVWQKRAETWKSIYCKGANDDEALLFIETCKRTGLSPEKRQIYATKRWDNQQRREVLTPITSIDGQRYIAQRSHNYGGQIGPQWCGDDGVWVDVWLKPEAPKAARCAVLRKDWMQPLWAVAKFDSYCQKTKDGKPAALWAKMPELMIAKCAEALALRRAFPDELGGLYTEDEMAQSIPASYVEEPHYEKKTHHQPLPQAVIAVDEVYEARNEQKVALKKIFDAVGIKQDEEMKTIAKMVIGTKMADLESKIYEIIAMQEHKISET